MNAKKKNPLFVVTNKGKDVEHAKNMFEVLVKKLGLTKTVSEIERAFHDFIQFLMSFIQNYAFFIAIKNMLDAMVEKLEAFVKIIYPEAYFYKA